MFNFFKRKNKKEMVSYWQRQESVEAKVYKTKQGHYEMQMQGEKYPFPGHPRGNLLYGSLSPLKHEIKNQIFNDVWAMLENDVPDKAIFTHVKGEVLPKIFALAEKSKFDFVPSEQLVPAVKELHRAMTVVEQKTGNATVGKLRDIMCFILEEDDGYRFRFQWIMKFLPLFKRFNVKHFVKGLELLEHAEIIGDMKERIRLLRRVLLFSLKDESINNCFNLLMKELDVRKVRLSKADKYFFRAKYFKVDFPEDTSY